MLGSSCILVGKYYQLKFELNIIGDAQFIEGPIFRGLIAESIT